MTITNGYCTLEEIKGEIQKARRYAGTTISFVASTKKIVDTRKRLARFQDGMIIDVSGSTSNNGTYTIAIGNVAGEIVVVETLTDEAAGDPVIIQDIADPVDDATLEEKIEAASRAIDTETCRRFYADAIDAVRYYAADNPYELWVDELISVTSVMTDLDGDGIFETTLAATDYVLWPYNAALEGGPYCRIDIAPGSSLTWPVMRGRGVKITGKFGYPSVPKDIKEACALLASRFFYRKDAVFGTVGSGEFQKDLAESDPDVRKLLRLYLRKT
jgi:hypothetical protein